MAGVKTQDFFPASAAAIQDPQLRRALERVGTGFDAARRDAIAEVTPQVWEEWREEARRIKPTRWNTWTTTWNFCPIG